MVNCETTEFDLQVDLFGRDPVDLSEKSTMRFEPIHLRSKGPLTLAFEQGIDLATQKRVETLVCEAFERLSELTGVTSNHPVIVLATHRIAVYGLIARMKDAIRKLVLWRPDWSDPENTWHFAHEATEIEILTLGYSIDRWLVEGLAQLSAYHVTGYLFPSEVNCIRESYLERGSATIEEVLKWSKPPGQYSSVQHINQDGANLLQKLLQFIREEHEAEKPLYGAVLELMLTWTKGEAKTVQTIFSRLACRRENPIHMMETLCGSLGGLKYV